MSGPSATSDRLARATGIAAALWGSVLLARGRDLWVLVDGRPPTDADLVALRFLGARHLVEGAAQAAGPSRFQRLYVAVDLSHAASMGWLAVVDERRRRPAVASGTVALAAAILTLAARRVRGRGR